MLLPRFSLIHHFYSMILIVQISQFGLIRVTCYFLDERLLDCDCLLVKPAPTMRCLYNWRSNDICCCPPAVFGTGNLTVYAGERLWDWRRLNISILPIGLAGLERGAMTPATWCGVSSAELPT